MRRSDHQAEFTQDIAALIRMAPNILPNHRVRLDYAKRDLEWQAIMHKRNPRGWAPANRSQHPKRLAVDLILDRRTERGWSYLTKCEHYAKLGRQWEMLSPFNRWGGRFKNRDGGHFERLETLREGLPVNA